MNRGISTVVDVSVAIVLVGASVALLAGVPAPDSPSHQAPGTGGTAIAGSTTTVQYERVDGQTAVVTGTAAGLLRDAAIARYRGTGGPFVEAVARSVASRIERTGTPAQLVAACPGSDPVVAGTAPPDERPVRATVYHWNESTLANASAATDRGDAADRCRPVVVVRRWDA